MKEGRGGKSRQPEIPRRTHLVKQTGKPLEQIGREIALNLLRMQARPAYRRAVAQGGAYLFDPATAAEASPFPLPKR